jgi:ERCC4-type nuclease
MSTYTILLDKRERKLIAACKELVIPYKTETLLLGDIHVVDEKGTICMMIERKTW